MFAGAGVLMGPHLMNAKLQELLALKVDAVTSGPS